MGTLQVVPCFQFTSEPALIGSKKAINNLVPTRYTLPGLLRRLLNHRPCLVVVLPRLTGSRRRHGESHVDYPSSFVVGGHISNIHQLFSGGVSIYDDEKPNHLDGRCFHS